MDPIHHDVTPGGFSVDAAVRYSGIGRSSLYGLIRAGEIRIVKIGRRTVVPRSELDNFLARRMTAIQPRTVA